MDQQKREGIVQWARERITIPRQSPAADAAQLVLEQEAEIAEFRALMDVIWRRTCLPFSDTDRHVIQQYALTYMYGRPTPGSQVERWLAEERK